MDENGKRFRVRVRGDSPLPDDNDHDEQHRQQQASTAAKKSHHETFAVRGGFKAEYDLVGESINTQPAKPVRWSADEADSISALLVTVRPGSATNPIPRLRLRPLPDHPALQHPQPRRSSATSLGLSTSPTQSRSNSPVSPEARTGSPSCSIPEPAPPPPLIPLRQTSPPPLTTSPPPLLSPPSTDTADAASDASSEAAEDREDEEPQTSPLMASTPRYFFGSVKSPIWALQAGAEEGLEGITKSPPDLRIPSATLSEDPDEVEKVEREKEDEEEEEEEDTVVPPGFTSVIGTSRGLGIPIVAIQPATPEGLLKYGGAGREIGEGDGLLLDDGGAFGDDGYSESVLSSS